MVLMNSFFLHLLFFNVVHLKRIVIIVALVDSLHMILKNPDFPLSSSEFLCCFTRSSGAGAQLEAITSADVGQQTITNSKIYFFLCSKCDEPRLRRT